jgi:hypothetical protein
MNKKLVFGLGVVAGLLLSLLLIFMFLIKADDRHWANILISQKFNNGYIMVLEDITNRRSDIMFVGNQNKIDNIRKGVNFDKINLYISGDGETLFLREYNTWVAINLTSFEENKLAQTPDGLRELIVEQPVITLRE